MYASYKGATMKIKFFAALILSVAMVAVGIPIAEAQPVKCTKQTVNVQNKNLVCVKSKGKYVWKKVVKKNTTPVYTEPAKPTVEVVKPEPPKNDTVTKPTVDTGSSTVQVDPRTKIFSNSLEQIDNFNYGQNIDVEYIFDPNFNTKYKNYVVDGEKRVFEVFGKYLSTSAKFIVIGSYSREHATAAWQSLYDRGTISYAMLRSSDDPIRRYFPNPVQKYTSGGWATFNNNVYIITYVGNPELPVRAHLKITGIHEMFHQVQYAINPRQTEKLPCWMVEGLPNLIGFALIHKQTDKKEIDLIISQSGIRTKTGFNLRNLEGVANRVYSNSFCGDLGEYQQGMAANAYLVNKFGIDKVMSFYAVTNSARSFSDDWVKMFETHFGQSVESFYSEAEEYIKWFYSLYFNGEYPKISTYDGQ